MVIPYDALATRMTRWSIGSRRSHSLVSLPPLPCATETGQRDYIFLICVMMLLRTPVNPEWSWGEAVTGVDREERC